MLETLTHRRRNGKKLLSPYANGFGYCSMCREYYPAYEETCIYHKIRLRLRARTRTKKEYPRIVVE
ncbi:MAG: hypothetical protein QW318_03265 [Candidatus Caldarchaeum sp.]|uniref:Uncharacterized protein n=1 Tax=Caldiarchaeum subterraneum TaxID=311458 RepID=A0A7C4I1M8_CALS0